MLTVGKHALRRSIRRGEVRQSHEAFSHLLIHARAHINPAAAAEEKAHNTHKHRVHTQHWNLIILPKYCHKVRTFQLLLMEKYKYFVVMGYSAADVRLPECFRQSLELLQVSFRTMIVYSACPWNNADLS